MNSRKSIFTIVTTLPTMSNAWPSNQPNHREKRSMVFADYDLGDNIAAPNINSFKHTVPTHRFADISIVTIIKFMLQFMITNFCSLNSTCERIHTKIMACFGPIFRRIRKARKVFHVLLLLLIVLPVVVATSIVSRIFIICFLRPIVEILLLVYEIILALEESTINL